MTSEIVRGNEVDTEQHRNRLLMHTDMQRPVQNPSAHEPFSALIFIFCKFGSMHISADYPSSAQMAAELVFTGPDHFKVGLRDKHLLPWPGHGKRIPVLSSP